ncbi:MAG: PadR family transcriptional regulator [Gemmatimonadaceae bacterium]
MTPNGKSDILQGMLDMLILKAVATEPLHGYAVAQRLRLLSRDRLQVPQGSLYPALHRLENRGWLKGDWADTPTGREAKFYRLTPKGKRQLATEVSQWKELAATIALVLELA